MSEKIINEKQESKEFVFEDLLKLREEYERGMDEIFDFDISASEEKQKIKEFSKDFVKKLLNQKEKFGQVFYTEKGSIYFILKSGESWRFKKKFEKEHEFFEDQPIAKKIIFVSKETNEELIGQRKKDPLFFENIVNQKIKLEKMAVGSVPIEIGIYGNSEVVFDEKENEIAILGTLVKFRDGTDEFEPKMFSGWHQGHMINEIVKN